MHSDFQLWFTTGLEHILNRSAMDHIAFILVLTVMYSYNQFRPLLIQVTSFTIGHSITLVLSVLGLISFKPAYTEILIVLTILFTALSNLYVLQKGLSSNKISYYLAAFFGLIHGMGFSYLLKAMLGKTESIVLPLFAFNLGIEIAQLLIVAILLIISFILVKFVGLKQRMWQAISSSLALVLSIYLLIDRLQYLL